MGKLSPHVFLLTAERLGVEFGNCIVIEGAAPSVTAANRAGMCCLTLASTRLIHSLTEADLVVDTLEAVSAKDVGGLLNQLWEA
jgi:beta-phosphoglucomutase-like phosphatase (HAD superfamily)